MTNPKLSDLIAALPEDEVSAQAGWSAEQLTEIFAIWRAGRFRLAPSSDCGRSGSCPRKLRWRIWLFGCANGLRTLRPGSDSGWKPIFAPR